MKKKFFCTIFITICFAILYSCNMCVIGADRNSVDINALVDRLINEGIGSNLGGQLIDGNYFGEEFFNTLHKDYSDGQYNGFTTPYAKNDKLYILGGKPVQTSYSEHYNGLHSFFRGIADEMRNSPTMKEFFAMAEKYTGISNDEYATALIETTVLELFQRRLNEVIDAYKKGCDEKPKGTFVYAGTKYNCDKFFSTGINYDILHTYDYINGLTASLIDRTKSIMDGTGSNVSDDADDKIKKENEKITGTTSNGSQNNDDSKDEKDEDEMNFKFDFIGASSDGYIPNLVNAVKFANKLANQGEIDSLSGSDKKNPSLNMALNDTISEFSNLGVYFLFSLLLILGVRMIWSGVEGRTQFKESLPYILLAIIFFYLAPKLVGLAEEALALREDMSQYTAALFSTFVYVVRVAAFAGIIFTGVKLMLSNAGARADLKKSLISVLVGCIFVFASSMIVSLIVDVSNDSGLQEIEGPNTSKMIEFKNQKIKI